MPPAIHSCSVSVDDAFLGEHDAEAEGGQAVDDQSYDVGE